MPIERPSRAGAFRPATGGRPTLYHRLERLADGLARALALAGGAVLIFIIVLSCVSIIGRALLPLGIGLGPVRGVYDLTEIGMAAAIFAFLPWAQMRDSHARVDLLEPVMPPVLNRLLDLAFAVAMTVVAVTGAWRLYLGMLDKRAFGETTVIAGIPVWLGYAGGLIGAVGFGLVSLFCILRALRRLSGRQTGEKNHVQH